MKTTVQLSSNPQHVLPKEYCARRNLKKGSALRVFEIAEESKGILARTGSFDSAETPEDEAMVQEIIPDFRAEKGRTK